MQLTNSLAEILFCQGKQFEWLIIMIFELKFDFEMAC